MRRVRTRVHPFDLAVVVEALQADGFPGLTLSEVLAEELTDGPLRPRVEVSIAMHDDRVERALQSLRRAGCRRGQEITVEPVEAAVRIRTGEIDEAAL